MERRRVAIVTDSLTPPAWAAEAIRQLCASDLVAVALIVVDRRPRRRAPLTYRLYEALDRRLFRAGRDALAAVELDVEAPVVELPGAELELRGANLDVIVQLAGEPLELAGCARHGVWSFRHGASRAAPFFWPMSRGEPATESELIADERRVVYRSHSRTDRLSLTRGRNAALWKAAHFPLRALRDPAAGDAPAERERGTPGPVRVLALAVRLAAGFTARRLRAAATREQWLIGYRRPGARFELVVPDRGSFYADPILIERGDRAHLFFEDYRYSERKAVIAHCAVARDGGRSAPRTVLSADHHVSYPFVFERDGEALMIPETSALRRVDLYRAVRFPDEWRHERTLLDGLDAVDATLVEHAGRLWLFACVAVPGTLPIDELCVWSAASLDGEWVPHPLNPVVSDVRRARPAGPLFVDGDGQLIRPGQDCARRYGAAIVLNRVDVLSERDYAETEVGRIDPGWLARGEATHTLSAAAGFEARDGMRMALGRGAG